MNKLIILKIQQLQLIKEFHKNLINYEIITDIEFNHKTSINCQARACLIFIYLLKNDKLYFLDNFDKFIELYDVVNKSEQMSLFQEIIMYVDLSNKETKDSRLVAWCKLHEGYLTVKQLRTKQCLQKQCHHLEKIGHSWWRKREKDKQLKKERKRRLMGITAPSIKPNEENVTSLNSLEYLKSCNEDNILLASIVDCLIEIDNEKEIKINNTTSAMNKEKTNKEKEVVEKKNSKSDPHKSLKNFRDKFIIL